MNIEYKKIYGREISDYLDQIAALRIEVFREFPYLYEGSLDYEKKYLQVYVDSDSSMIILAIVDGIIIGASTCLAMSDESEEFKEALIKADYDISKIFYFGESIIKKELRGNKIGHEFFRMREEHALKCIADLEFSTFCAVDRTEDHPLKPKSYRPLDLFWNRMGYQKSEDLRVYYPWKDIDKDREDKKMMSIWLKPF